ncbi:NAD+ diphosphatase [Micromonospora citrea]|uniref:NAD(+) diphosphatase n=1 Tax=Micromonospora citrea TaxID=47855 RepID=A0A1C6UKZ3_9ACTN|nr:NUDIX domain-containing protein [Micromonospora citrea]SCL54755.1 NAD+ diphosphatase [Micromonospora citrea]
MTDRPTGLAPGAGDDTPPAHRLTPGDDTPPVATSDGFVPGAGRDTPPAPTDLALPVAGRKLLTRADGAVLRVADLPAGTGWVPLGTLGGVPAWAAEPAAPQELPGRWRGWAALAAEASEPLAALAGRALTVVTWRRTHRWCGACRAELADVPGESARRCPECELYVPMRLSAAVLVAITRPGPAGRPDELLLVRHSYGPTALWALVAGFVESGETLEAAAHREVGEEVGLTLTGLSYFGSQPWALSGPNVLLTGFTATADAGAEPAVDGRELTEARWFPLDGLPAELPPGYSISRWLIDATAAGGRRRPRP